MQWDQVADHFDERMWPNLDKLKKNKDQTSNRNSIENSSASGVNKECDGSLGSVGWSAQQNILGCSLAGAIRQQASHLCLHMKRCR